MMSTGLCFERVGPGAKSPWGHQRNEHCERCRRLSSVVEKIPGSCVNVREKIRSELSELITVLQHQARFVGTAGVSAQQRKVKVADLGRKIPPFLTS